MIVVRTITKVLLFTFFLSPSFVEGQLSINTANTSFYITFDSTVQDVNNGTFQGEGFQPNPAPGQIDSDAFRVTGLSEGNVPFGGTGISGDFARGTATGDVSTGGIYGFQVEPGNLTLGANPRGGDFRPGTFTLLAVNNTGEPIEPVQVSYDLWTLNSDNRSTQVEFAWSTDDQNYTMVSALTYNTNTTADQLPIWMKNPHNTTISTTLNPGDSIYLRWTGSDNGGQGPENDQFSLDSIELIMEASAFLPVTWLSFEVSKEDHNAHLYWTTSHEINNDRFEVLHSQDGLEWKKVGAVAAEGQRDVNQYQFEHTSPVSGRNFYRIKQVDKDGQYNMSEIETVFFKKSSPRNLTLYPNPATKYIEFGNVQELDIGNVKVYNNKGEVVKRYVDELPEQIFVGNLPEGLYWLTYRLDDRINKKKFIIE